MQWHKRTNKTNERTNGQTDKRTNKTNEQTNKMRLLRWENKPIWTRQLLQLVEKKKEKYKKTTEKEGKTENEWEGRKEKVFGQVNSTLTRKESFPDKKRKSMWTDRRTKIKDLDR